MVGDGDGMTNADIVALIKRNPRYAKHLQLLRGGTPSQAKPNLPDLRRCIHLGAKIPGQPCGSPLTVCSLHMDVTSQLYPCTAANRCCEGCPDKAYRQPFAAKADDARAGVAIGSFRWPELVELQCKVIRDTCGPVPILVSNDDPEAHGVLVDICEKFHDVTLDTNQERIGHIGGDIAVFSKAVRWGVERGLQVVAKLSQRFIIDRTRWLQDSAAELLVSGLPLASRRCRGDVWYDLRTEAVLMDITQWDRPDVIERIKPRRYWNDEANGLPAETIIFRLLQDLLGGIFWPWASLMGEDRYKRDANDILWHYNTTDREYRKLAARYLVRLPDEFHVSGWEQELKEGKYVYG